ncbi:hypothetical protein ELI_1966 [Eubacterium callanderi]|uniref:Uncharacterized protein n=1 Tax=Eubacterium callanderi TaxID=53442 RepID=E3GDL9_9FIRM|nr:hypothetical protein ELI_1966 [Eubacterium callanderi]
MEKEEKKEERAWEDELEEDPEYSFEIGV